MGNMSATPASRPPGQQKAGREILTLLETSAKVPPQPHSPDFCSSIQSTKAEGQGGLCSTGRAEILGEVQEGEVPCCVGLCGGDGRSAASCPVCPRTPPQQLHTRTAPRGLQVRRGCLHPELCHGAHQHQWKLRQS